MNKTSFKFIVGSIWQVPGGENQVISCVVGTALAVCSVVGHQSEFQSWTSASATNFLAAIIHVDDQLKARLWYLNSAKNVNVQFRIPRAQNIMHVYFLANFDKSDTNWQIPCDLAASWNCRYID